MRVPSLPPLSAVWPFSSLLLANWSPRGHPKEEVSLAGRDKAQKRGLRRAGGAHDMSYWHALTCRCDSHAVLRDVLCGVLGMDPSAADRKLRQGGRAEQGAEEFDFVGSFGRTFCSLLPTAGPALRLWVHPAHWLSLRGAARALPAGAAMEPEAKLGRILLLGQGILAQLLPDQKGHRKCLLRAWAAMPPGSIVSGPALEHVLRSDRLLDLQGLSLVKGHPLGPSCPPAAFLVGPREQVRPAWLSLVLGGLRPCGLRLAEELLAIGT